MRLAVIVAVVAIATVTRASSGMPPSQQFGLTDTGSNFISSHTDMLEGLPTLQEKFAKDFVQGKFPAFDKDKVVKSEERLKENPYSDAVGEKNYDFKMKGEAESKQWWEGKKDEEITGRFHMTPDEFRKASDALLKWMDDRMGDLDALYDQTILIGRMTGVPVDRILDKEVSPALSKWVEIAQEKAGNPFDGSMPRSEDGHVFPNRVKNVINQFRVQLLQARAQVRGHKSVDLTKLAELVQAEMRKSSYQPVVKDDGVDNSYAIPGADTANQGFVFSPGSPMSTIGIHGEAMKIMDDTVAPPDVVDDDDGGIVDVLDMTRGVF